MVEVHTCILCCIDPKRIVQHDTLALRAPVMWSLEQNDGRGKGETMAKSSLLHCSSRTSSMLRCDSTCWLGELINACSLEDKEGRSWSKVLRISPDCAARLHLHLLFGKWQSAAHRLVVEMYLKSANCLETWVGLLASTVVSWNAVCHDWMHEMDAEAPNRLYLYQKHWLRIMFA